MSESSKEPRLSWASEEYQWHNQKGCIEHVKVFVGLPEETLLLVPTFSHDFFVDFISSLQPLVAPGAREGPLVRQSQTTVNCNPHHHLGVNKVLRRAPDFPDGEVRSLVVANDI